MKTLRLALSPDHLEMPEAQQALNQAAAILRAGGLVAMPTETVYGLGANALDTRAVESIFAAKKRPAWDPVIVHISHESMLDALVTGVPESARKLMQAFWPGPLTLLLPRSAAVPDPVTAGRPLVGIRMPAHPVALRLIQKSGLPIAAPSANIFSHISPTTAAHVLHDLDGRIDAVLDAGPTLHGVESTVLDPFQTPMVIYRPGSVTAAQIRDVAGPVEIFQPHQPLADAPASALPSPGVGLRHYAPRAKLILIEAPLVELAAQFLRAARLTNLVPHLPLSRGEGTAGTRLGVMLPEGVTLEFEEAAVYRWGRWDRPDELANGLYNGLRWLDEQGCKTILCPLPSEDGVGAAIRDRLHKAAQK